MKVIISLVRRLFAPHKPLCFPFSFTCVKLWRFPVYRLITEHPVSKWKRVFLSISLCARREVPFPRNKNCADKCVCRRPPRARQSATVPGGHLSLSGKHTVEADEWCHSELCGLSFFGWEVGVGGVLRVCVWVCVFTTSTHTLIFSPARSASFESKVTPLLIEYCQIAGAHWILATVKEMQITADGNWFLTVAYSSFFMDVV